ncbi:YciI family protein [Georgenia halophila]|uniref:YciI family protein n=1 Tax=Georgenia halophila TaxID=620889 RepID=A0ABP8LEG6_9MICO
MTKFLLLMTEQDHFDRWEQADEALQARVATDFEAFTEAVEARGALVAGEALARPDQARTVRPGPDRPVTEGPYAETAEQLGGLWIIDMPGMDEAVAAAALLPAEYSVEIRPISQAEG